MTNETDELPEKLSREDILKLISGDIARSYIADHFAKYCLPWAISRFLCRYELSKMIQNVSGSIVECGLRSGAGLLEWHQISKLLEPLNRRRIVYGFDTFAGFPSVSAKDGSVAKVGDQHSGGEIDSLIRAIVMHTSNYILMNHDGKNWLRPRKFVKSHMWDQIVPVKGDFMKTGPKFMKENPHLIVSLLFLDFDLYEPTKKAIDLFLPRMPKGSVIVFDELDHPDWPGETLALLETVGIRNLELKRFAWESTLGWAVLT